MMKLWKDKFSLTSKLKVVLHLKGGHLQASKKNLNMGKVSKAEAPILSNEVCSPSQREY